MGGDTMGGGIEEGNGRRGGVDNDSACHFEFTQCMPVLLVKVVEARVVSLLLRPVLGVVD